MGCIRVLGLEFDFFGIVLASGRLPLVFLNRVSNLFVKRLQFLAVVLAVLLFLQPQPASAKSFYFDNVTLTYAVDSDGLVSVTENLSFVFDGAFSYAIREFPDGPWNITNITVEEVRGADSLQLKYSLIHNENVQRLKWYYSASDENRSFIIKYFVNYSIVSYEDAFDFQWRAWGSEWDAPVKNLTAFMVFPLKPYSGSRVWIHSPITSANYSFKNETLALAAWNIPARTYVDFRVLFNKEVLTGNYTRAVAGLGYDKVVKEEADLAFLQNISVFLWIWPAIVFVLLAFSFYFLYEKYGREPHPINVRVETELKFDDKPWEVEYIIKQKITDSSMIATLLDLVRRGHLRVEKIASSSAPERGDYLLARKQGKDGLHEFENWLLEELFSRKPPKTFMSFWKSVFQDKSFKEQDSSTTSMKLSEIAKAHANDEVSMQEQWLSIVGKEVNGKDERKYLDFSGKNLFSRLLLFLGILTFALQFFATKDYTVGVAEIGIVLLLYAVLIIGSAFLFRKRLPLDKPVLLTVLATIAFFVLFGFQISLSLLPVFFILLSFVLVDAHFKYTLTRFTEAGESRYEAWAGLDKFLDETEDFKEKIPSDVSLWERYLIYGVVFGNYDRIAREMQSLNVVPKDYPGFAATVGSPSFLEPFIIACSLNFTASSKSFSIASLARGGSAG